MNTTDPRDRPGYYVETEDQARNVIVELVSRVERLRLVCNVSIPDPDETLVREQRRVYREYTMWYGHTAGFLVCLHRTKRISDVCYNELLSRLAQTAQPTLIG